MSYNRFLELAAEDGVKSPKHHNLCSPRVKQGKNRAKKGGYFPLGARARHDDPSKGS